MNNIKKLKMFFSLSWSVSPMYIFLLILSTLVNSGQILVNVILPKFLIDELTGDMNINRLILFGSAIVVSNLFFAFLVNTMKRIMELKNLYVRHKMNQEMAKK